MKRFTLILSLLVAMVTTAMAQTIMELEVGESYTINLSAESNNFGHVYYNAESTDNLYYDATYTAANATNANYHFVFTEAGTDANGNKLYYISPKNADGVYAYNKNESNGGGSANSVGLTSDETVKTEKGKWYVYDNGTYQFIVPAWKDGDNYVLGGCCWNAWSDPAGNYTLGMWGRGAGNPDYAGDNCARIELVTFSSDYYYQIVNKAYSTGLKEIEGKAGIAISSSVNANDQSQLWTIEKTADGKYKLKNKSTGNYLAYNATTGQCWDVNANGYEFYLGVQNAVAGANGSTMLYYYISGAEIANTAIDSRTCAHDANWGSGYSYKQIVTWDNSADASQWKFIRTDIEIGTEYFTVTYNYTYNGVTVYTQETDVASGSGYPAFDVPNAPLGVVPAENVPEGTVTADVTEDIELTINNELIPFEYAASVDAITTWYYAQIHSNDRTYLYDDGEEANIEWVNARKTFTVDAADNNSWAFVGSPLEGFKMVSKNRRAIVSTGGVSDNVTMGTVDAATAFLAMPTSENVANGFCLMNPNVEGTWYMNAHDGYVKHWNDNDAGSTIVLTERQDFDITVSDLGYATLYLGYNAWIPADVEAYIVSGIEGEYAQMTQVTGTLPANTGVILKNAGDYTFTTSVASGTEIADVTGNYLAGTTIDTEITKEEGNSYYVLANKNGIGFYNAVLGEDATKFKNAANKAYLVVPGAAEAASYSFRFGEGTTGIDQITDNRVQSTAIYDLTGRRVENISAPGIYVVNGKKVLVK